MPHLPRAGRAALLAALLAAPAALAQPGALDPTFGGGHGFVVADFAPGGASYDRIEAIVRYPDGRAIVVGSSGHDLAVARFLNEGTLDTTFGDGGSAFAGFSDANEPYFGEDVVLQPDGKVLIAGQRGGFEAASRLLLARRLPDGAPDSAFGPDASGVVLVDTPGLFDHTPVVALQPDGRILLGGTDSQGGQLARFLPDGALDTSFGEGGYASVPFTGLAAVALQPDGRIVATGTTGGHFDTEVAVLRLNPDGTTDRAFGTNGLATTDLGFSTFAVALTLQSGGEALVLAFHRGATYGDGYSLIRHLPDGTLDGAFGAGGVVRGAEPVHPASLALQPDGKVLVGGANPSYLAAHVAFARHRADGSPDPTFGTEGLAYPAFGGAVEWVAGLALQPDGRALIAGTSGDVGADQDLVVARLLGDAAVAVSAAPEAPPVVIPPAGGAFSFDVTLANVTDLPQAVEVWTEADGPLSRSPVLGPYPVTLAPREVLVRTVTQRVPGAAPAGGYAYTVQGGAFPGSVVTSASLPITKETGMVTRSGAGEATWTVEGWASSPWAAPATAGASAPMGPRLSIPSPHPFRDAARLTLEAPTAQPVRAAVYDALGREVALLHDGPLAAGAHVFVLDGSWLAPGVYVVRAEGEGASAVRRVVRY